MKLYDKIIKCLEHGVFPIVRNMVDCTESRFIIDSFYPPEHILMKEIEEVGEGSGCAYDGALFDENYINQNFIWTGKYYTTPRKPYEVGQKVRIIDQKVDNDDYYFAKKHFNDICYIQEVKDSFEGLYYNIHKTTDMAGGLHCMIRHDWLEPVIDEEDKDHECDWVIFSIDWSIYASKYKCRLCGKIKEE